MSEERPPEESKPDSDQQPIQSEPADEQQEPVSESAADQPEAGPEPIPSETDPESISPTPEPGPEQTPPETSLEQVPPEREPSPEPAIEEKPAPEKRGFGYFLKRGLRWAVFVMVIFTIGVVLMQLLRVQPLVDQRNDLNVSLSEAQATVRGLQGEVDRLEGVEAENEALSEEIRQVEARLALLNILVDVTRAQLALAQEDTVRVAAALQGTGEKLSSLRGLLGSTATTDLDGLRERLVLVLSEVDGDPFAAERDLEILANTLLEIEQELSGE